MNRPHTEQRCIRGFEILPDGSLGALGTAEVPQVASALSEELDQEAREGNPTAREGFMMRLLYLTLPKHWCPEFGALINGNTWVTGPGEAALWLRRLDELLAVSGVNEYGANTLLFGDTYDADRSDATGQRQGMVPAFFVDLLEGSGDANIATVFPRRSYFCGYSYDLSLLGPQYKNQWFQIYESIQLGEVVGDALRVSALSSDSIN